MIIKHLAILSILVLSACSTKEPSEVMAENAIQSVIAIEKSLPNECKTESVKQQLLSIKGQIATISTACETEKNVLEQKITIRNLIIALLLALIGFWVFKKITK